MIQDWWRCIASGGSLSIHQTHISPSIPPSILVAMGLIVSDSPDVKISARCGGFPRFSWLFVVPSPATQAADVSKPMVDKYHVFLFNRYSSFLRALNWKCLAFFIHKYLHPNNLDTHTVMLSAGSLIWIGLLKNFSGYVLLQFLFGLYRLTQWNRDLESGC